MFVSFNAVVSLSAFIDGKFSFATITNRMQTKYVGLFLHRNPLPSITIRSSAIDVVTAMGYN